MKSYTKHSDNNMSVLWNSDTLTQGTDVWRSWLSSSGMTGITSCGLLANVHGARITRPALFTINVVFLKGSSSCVKEVLFSTLKYNIWPLLLILYAVNWTFFHINNCLEHDRLFPYFIYQNRKLCLRFDQSNHTYLGGFEGVVCWKMNRQEENTSLIWTVTLTEKDKKIKIKINYFFFFFKRDIYIFQKTHSYSLSSQISTLLQIHFKRSGTLLQCQISAPCCHKPDKGNNCAIKHLLTGPMIVACQWNTAENRK